MWIKNVLMLAECLDQLGSLIENYGVSVCRPTLSAAMKEVTKQMEDRDSHFVHNAALNCFQVFLLQRQIERAAKIRSVFATRRLRWYQSTFVVATSSPPTDDMEADYEEEQEEIADPMETVPELWVIFTRDLHFILHVIYTWYTNLLSCW